MRYILFSLFILVTACSTTKPRESAVVAPVGALTLEAALQQAPTATLSYLKTQTASAENPEKVEVKSIQKRDVASLLPDSLKAEKNTAPAPREKSQQQAFLRKFRNWTVAKKTKHGKELVEKFNCEQAVETQSLGYSLELDFPEQEARDVSRSLHEKVLTCENFAKNESIFRLAVFSIQQGECDKAMTYFGHFPAEPERTIRDRISYIKGFCSGSREVSYRNPLGGYGILLTDSNTSEVRPQWYLSTKSGSADWDSVMQTMIELTEAGDAAAVKYIASKMNFDKFRELPLPFQTSMMVLMSYNEADLPVFQNLHRYLSEHPEMLSSSIAGLLFPVRYWKEITEHSRKADPILVKALIRQESAFNRFSRSRAKASGLMQLIYPTAKLFGVTQPKQLTDPEINITAGSAFLGQLINQFGSVELALAAYNAGPAMVRQWQKRYPTDNIDLFVEMIPYSETREYVRLVTRNYKVYQTLLMKPQVLGQMNINK